MNRKYLLVSLALFFFASSASEQALAGSSDTVKITIINPVNEHHAGVKDSNFVARITASIDTGWIAASLGFTWGTKPEDSINWTVDSAVLGPALQLWDLAFATLKTDSATTVLIGGADFFANNPFGPGTDLLLADIYFSLRPGNNFTAGSDMIIDSTFVPPAGPWLVTLVVVDTGSSNRSPSFTGAQKVTFNNIEEVTDAPLPTT
ncbi:MAG: hypothetical protein IIB00_07985, partial [candidate division Zixibacteria bacterium]|nr:hypothetical protein [candidate division Zixibacteria bacterium]